MGIFAKFIKLLGIPVAERTTIGRLPQHLKMLENGEAKLDVMGITSNGIDCVYFVYDRGKYEIEYEAILAEQVHFIDKVKEFSTIHSYNFSMTTHGNPTDYPPNGDAPVVRIAANANLKEICELAQKMMQSVFGNNERTEYEVVP